MSINLKVICHGMVAYVPSPDGKRMAVLLCKAPGVRNQKTYVRFHKDNFDQKKNRRKARVPKKAPKELENHRHILLNNERLSIEAKTSEPLNIDFSKDSRNKKETPTGRDEKSFYWMPDIDKLTNGGGDINQQHLLNPAAATPTVLARIDFTNGRLGTTGTEKIKVPFRKKYDSRTQQVAVAREALLELTIDSDEFTLKSTPLNGKRRAQKDLRFKGKGEVKIVIGNEPERDIYQLTPSIQPIDILAREARGEFNLYHDICAAPQPPADRLMPFVFVRPGLIVFCDGARYKASADVTG